MKRRLLLQIYLFPEKTEIFHPATVRHRSIPHCAASDDAAARGPWFPGAPTCGNGSRAAGSVLRPLPRGRPQHLPSALGVFFYAPSAVQDRLAQSRDEACVAEIPTAETDAGIAVPPSRSRTPCHSSKLRPTSFAAVTHCYADDFGGGPGNFSLSFQVPSD